MDNHHALWYTIYEIEVNMFYWFTFQGHTMMSLTEEGAKELAIRCGLSPGAVRKGDPRESRETVPSGDGELAHRG